jgi:superfamily II RNA helicase
MPVTSPILDAPAPRPPSPEDEALLDSFRQRYPFALDPFQEQAIRWVLSGESVLVSRRRAGKT